MKKEKQKQKEVQKEIRPMYNVQHSVYIHFAHRAVFSHNLTPVAQSNFMIILYMVQFSLHGEILMRIPSIYPVDIVCEKKQRIHSFKQKRKEIKKHSKKKKEKKLYKSE